jgi:hypothetical protein
LYQYARLFSSLWLARSGGLPEQKKGLCRPAAELNRRGLNEKKMFALAPTHTKGVKRVILLEMQSAAAAAEILRERARTHVCSNLINGALLIGAGNETRRLLGKSVCARTGDDN